METRLDAAWVERQLPPRGQDTHKGDYGKLTILGGSAAYRGAPVLAASGALRAGVGILRLASTERVCAAAAAQLPCCTLLPLAEHADGSISPSSLAPVLAADSTALLAGCGMGNSRNTAALLAELLERYNGPLVLDADALNVLAGHLDTGSDEILRKSMVELLVKFRHPLVLTPHIGEMARLAARPVREIAARQREAATAMAVKYSCIIVLKSHVTVVASPTGDIWINDSAGNPGLAKGGSGDVLAGIIAALLAQGVPAEAAAAAGVWLHAASADLAARALSETGMSPHDLPVYLCDVWKQLGR